jgi:acetylornithine deacetylase/succinyl-diaminopimelate desuccinylase-like protein
VGFAAADVEVVAPGPKKGNVVARLRGKNEGRPVLFLAHLDVVEARREDWTSNPFALLEKDGYPTPAEDRRATGAGFCTRSRRPRRATSRSA